jgi:hypothetical protein
MRKLSGCFLEKLAAQTDKQGDNPIPVVLMNIGLMTKALGSDHMCNGKRKFLTDMMLLQE